ncbi:MAG: HDOD domain-containing protein [Myxococcota bacterium]
MDWLRLFRGRRRRPLSRVSPRVAPRPAPAIPAAPGEAHPLDLTTGLEAELSRGELRAEVERILREEWEGAAGIADRDFLSALSRAVARDGLQLPPMPEAMLRVQRLVDSPDCDVATLARELERDPTLATKIVGVANSTYYAGLEPVSSLRDAVIRIGLRETRNIVLVISMRSKVFRIPGFRSETEALWRHSLAASITTQEAAALGRLDPDQGFLAGLVHDLGRIAMLMVSGEVLQASRGRSSAVPEAFGAILDRVHTPLSALLAESWHLPSDLVEALYWHHAPEGAPEASRALARAIRAGDLLAHDLESASEAPSDPEALLEVGLDAEAAGDVLQEAAPRFQAIAKAL